RGPGTEHASSPSAAPPVTVSTPKPIGARHVAPPLAPPPTSAIDRAKAAATKLAARLPVRLEPSALLRSGSTLYVPGGTTPPGALDLGHLGNGDRDARQVLGHRVQGLVVCGIAKADLHSVGAHTDRDRGSG